MAFFERWRCFLTLFIGITFNLYMTYSRTHLYTYIALLIRHAQRRDAFNEWAIARCILWTFHRVPPSFPLSFFLYRSFLPFFFLRSRNTYYYSYFFNPRPYNSAMGPYLTRGAALASARAILTDKIITEKKYMKNKFKRIAESGLVAPLSSTPFSFPRRTNAAFEKYVAAAIYFSFSIFLKH